MWLYLEISYNLDGFAKAILAFFWNIFSSSFVSDLLKELFLFFLVALGLFGTISLSRRREKRVWVIVSFIVAIFSLIGLLLS